MNIVFISDNNYAFPTKVVIKSLIANKDKTTKYSVNVIAIEFTKSNIELIKNLETEDVKINIIERSNEYKNIGEEHLYVSKAALFKFQLPNIFNNLDKILYLDVDMIIKKDLKDIYNIDLKDNYAAVVKDYQAESILKSHKKIKHKNYFNSGMMFLNLKKMRENNIPDKLLEIKKVCDCSFMDQDALNIAFEEKVVYLPLKYNLMISNLGFDKDGIAKFYNITKDDLEETFNNPLIIHLTNRKKPWNDITAAKSDEFWKYADNIDIIRFIQKQKSIKFKTKIFLKKLRRILIHTLCVFIPIKSLRKKIRNKYIG